MRVVALLMMIASAALAASIELPPYGEIDGKRILTHIRKLAHDDMRGRGSGSAEIDLAADYIVQQLAAVGCEPAGDVDGWYQEFRTFPLNQLDKAQANLNWADQTTQPILEQDWVPMPFSALGDASGEVAFAGYGIQSTQYDDYADFDAAGKMLLMLRYEPPTTERFGLLGDEYPSSHATFARKARLAAEQGAEAIFIVNPPSRSFAGQPLYRFSPLMGGRLVALPVVHISQAFADRLLAAGGLPPISALEARLNADRRPRSENLEGVRLELKQGLRREGLPARNVLGLLRASVPSNSYVVVGAHYDHIGVRPGRGHQLPQIHNGADDNASGVAGLLEIARLLSQQPMRNRHVLFIAFGGEELGLLGSKHFVQHPLIKLRDIRAMVNLDMIGRLYDKKLQTACDDDDRALKKALRLAARKLHLETEANTTFRGRTDHAPFEENGIPTLFVSSGLHADYHLASDDWEWIDPIGTTRITALLADVVSQFVVTEAARNR